MNDQPDEFLRVPLEPLPEKPLPHGKALEQVKTAIGNLITAIRLLEQSSYFDGWNKSSEWTMEQLKKFAEKTASETLAKATTVAAQPRMPMDSMSIGEPLRVLQVRPAADVVYEVIERNPGLTGVQIVRHLERAGTPLNERTVRTALFRLKVDKIAAVENRWYTKEMARDAAEARSERIEREHHERM